MCVADTHFHVQKQTSPNTFHQPFSFRLVFIVTMASSRDGMRSTFSTNGVNFALQAGGLKDGGFARGLSNFNLALTFAAALGGVIVSAYALENADALQIMQESAAAKQTGKGTIIPDDHKTLFTVLLIIASLILLAALVEGGARAYAHFIKHKKKSE